MLSDRDRETLREVQRRLVIEDPAFARSFGAADGQQDLLAWLTAVPRWVYTCAFVVTLLLGALMIVARAPGTALAFAVIATLVSMARRRRDGDAAAQRSAG